MQTGGTDAEPKREQGIMSDGFRKRRRWVIGLFVIGGLLAGVPLAWRYRPMSETERRLVGTWAVGNDTDRSRIELTRGRRIVANGGGTKTLGVWYASEGKLYVSYDQPFPQTWGDVPEYLTQIVSRDHGLDVGPIDLQFEGSARVHVRYQTLGDGEASEEVMERVP